MSVDDTHLKMCRLQRKLEIQSAELGAEIAEWQRVEQELEEHREHLEKMVEERTKEPVRVIAEQRLRNRSHVLW